MKFSMIIHFLIGPLLLVLAIIFKLFPPKEINSLYGYRTKTSMQSQAHWDEANRYSSNAMVVVAIIVIVVQVITWKFFDANKSVLISTVVMLIGVLALIPLTEYHLKKWEKQQPVENKATPAPKSQNSGEGG